MAANLKLKAILVFGIRTLAATAAAATATQGRQFISLDPHTGFTEISQEGSDRVLLVSPLLQADLKFNELIVSWNAELPRDTSLVVEARASHGGSNTKYYSFGVWSQTGGKPSRHSMDAQSDSEGEVATDTLRLHHPADALQVRLTIIGKPDAKRILKFVGVSLTDTSFVMTPVRSNQKAWGTLLAVPERTQMAYPNGKVLCSPTTVSMILGHWAQALNRPELDPPVPQVAEGVYDAQWKGTGNWPFNMAYAGSFPGLRAYVTRLSDVTELEAWIARGFTVGLSLDYDRLRDKGPGPNGHLVVLVGFTKQGDPIINDPGTSEHIRKTFPRARLIDAWACSRNTVYLVYPENHLAPEDPFGHWDSPQTRSRIRVGE